MAAANQPNSIENVPNNEVENNKKPKSFCQCFRQAIKDLPLVLLLLIAFLTFALSFYKPIQNDLEEIGRELPEKPTKNGNEWIGVFALPFALFAIWLIKALYLWKESKMMDGGKSNEFNVEFIRQLAAKNRRIALYSAIIVSMVVIVRFSIHKYVLGPVADRKFAVLVIASFFDVLISNFATFFLQIPWGLPLALAIARHPNLAQKAIHLHRVNFAVLITVSIFSNIFLTTTNFNFSQLLWANLILSTILSFVMANGRDGNGAAENRILCRNTVGIAIYQTIVLLGLFLFGPKLIPAISSFASDYDGRLAGTIIFHTFVLMMLANALFASQIYSGKNIFEISWRREGRDSQDLIQFRSLRFCSGFAFYFDGIWRLFAQCSGFKLVFARILYNFCIIPADLGTAPRLYSIWQRQKCCIEKKCQNGIAAKYCLKQKLTWNIIGVWRASVIGLFPNGTIFFLIAPGSL